MNQTLARLQKMRPEEYSSFVQVLFGLATPSPLSTDLAAGAADQLEFVDPSLNDSQKQAIRFALASREVALIHGPPGVCHLGSLPSLAVGSEMWLTRATDGEDSHVDRADLADAEAEPARSRVWTVEHLG